MSLEQQEYALRGIPFHLTTIGEWEDLKRVLSDLDFIQEKVIRGMAYNLIGDYQFATAQLMDVEAFKDVNFVISEYARAFNQEFISFLSHPELTAQQIFNNLYSHYGFKSSTGQCLRRFIDHKSYPHAAMWLRQFNTTPSTNRPRELLRTLSGHTAAVRTVCISNDGNKIVSGGLDGRICVWKWEDGSLITSFDAHIDGVVAMTWYSGDLEEKRIVTVGGDQFIRVWDFSLGKKLLELDTKVEGINSIGVMKSTGYVCICSDDGIIRVWDLKILQEVYRLQGHWGRIMCLGTLTKDAILISGGEDLTLRVWHLGSTVKTERLHGHMDTIRSVVIEPEGKWAVSAGDDKTLRIWELGEEKKPTTLSGHSQSIRSIAIASDKYGIPLIISGSDDETIKVWNRQTGNLVRTLRTNQLGINALAFNFSNQYFVSAGEDGTIVVWDANIEPTTNSWIEHEDKILSLTSVRKRVASASSDGTVRLWNSENGDHCFNLRGHFEPVSAVAILKNKIVSCGQDGLVKVSDLETGKLLVNLNKTLGQQIAFSTAKNMFKLNNNDTNLGHIGPINCLCQISPHAIISGGSDRTARLWDLETGQELITFRGAASNIEMLAFSPKYLALIAAGVGRNISVWTTVDEIKIKYLTGHTNSITALCLTQNNQLVSSSRDGTIRLWDIPSSNEIKRFCGHEHWVQCANVFGEYIVSGGDDGTVRVWDIPSGREVYVLRGHSAPIRAIVIDPDTERLFTCGEDRRVNVWELRDGVLRASVYLNSIATHLAIVDSQTLCVGTQQGGVIFFSLIVNE